ncbi:MAG: hypothetical protein ABSB89_08995 [Candidatus Bathyarchaeia archaeon]|jgi:cytoskeletal protein CcmA (bactofilin family)
MSSLQIKSGETAQLDHVNGDLHVGRNAKIKPRDGKRVTVNKAAVFEGNASVEGDFECDSLTVNGKGTLRVNGNLKIHNKLDVMDSLFAMARITALEIDVGGKVTAGSVVCSRLRAGGVVEVEDTLEAETVDVGRRVTASGQVALKSLQVGGKTEIGGGTITELAKMSGTFSSSSKLNFSELQVYGKASLPTGCKGQRIRSFGRLCVDGSITCEEIMVEGAADIRGDCHTAKMEVDGRLDVSGSLMASNMLESFGQTEIVGQLQGKSLRVGGKFKAREVVLTETADLMGDVKTEDGLRAKSLIIRTGTRCEGIIVGERVEVGKSSLVVANWATKWAHQSISIRLVGKMTQVNDVYGTKVTLGKASKARRIFAQDVELENGSIAEQVTYTGELKRSDHVFIRLPPEKAIKLPDPPLKG